MLMGLLLFATTTGTIIFLLVQYKKYKSGEYLLNRRTNVSGYNYKEKNTLRDDSIVLDADVFEEDEPEESMSEVNELLVGLQRTCARTTTESSGEEDLGD